MHLHDTVCRCDQCGVEFTREIAEIRRGSDRFCSPTCRHAAVRAASDLNCTCERCGKHFHLPASKIAKGMGRYCSHECKKAPVGRRYEAQGYIFVRQEDGTWRHEHRIVMEGLIGRPLLTTEHVHHINGNKADNAPENLQLLSDVEHARGHLKVRLPLVAGAWGEDRPACVACGGTDLPHKGRGLCAFCYRRKRTLARNPDAPLGRWPA